MVVDAPRENPIVVSQRDAVHAAASHVHHSGGIGGQVRVHAWPSDAGGSCFGAESQLGAAVAAKDEDVEACGWRVVDDNLGLSGLALRWRWRLCDLLLLGGCWSFIVFGLDLALLAAGIGGRGL